MSRTPLFAALRHAIGLAALSRRPGAPPLAELADPGFPRRRFLGAAGAALLPGLPAIAQPRITAQGARIAVVGAGLAGLVATHRLVEAGGNVTLYEANTRTGGRILSGRDLLGAGTVVELGGSFINAEHGDVLALAREFGLPLEDGAAETPALLGTYFVGGQHHAIADIAAEAAPVLPRIAALREGSEDAKAATDRRSAAEVMDALGISGWLRRLLDLGLTQEMGLEPDRMSGLYFTEYFAPDPARPQRGLFSSDQRFQVEGGNDRLPAAIAARHAGRIRTGHRLVALRRRGNAMLLVFDLGGQRREVVAEIVVMTLPATILRQVEMDVGAPPLTHRAIRELGYGTNAKLFAGLSARPWRAAGRSGECLNDLGIQTVWEDHGKPGAGPGSMTIFAGGRTGADFARGRAADRARAATQAIDAALPGAAAAFTGRASRMNWPGNPYVGGSYSCFGPGQWTGFAEAFEPVGQMVFAGEHTAEHSGYMDGAAESGRKAAEAVVRLLG